VALEVELIYTYTRSGGGKVRFKIKERERERVVPIALATNWTTKNFKSKLEREGEKQIRDIPSGVIPTLALISKINAGVCKCSLTKLKTFPNRQRIDDLNFCAFVT
jgi:hypothetical protein